MKDNRALSHNEIATFLAGLNKDTIPKDWQKIFFRQLWICSWFQDIFQVILKEPPTQQHNCYDEPKC